MDKQTLYKTVEQLNLQDDHLLRETALQLTQEEIFSLIELLKEKHDTTQYHASILLQLRSEHLDDVYPYFDSLFELMQSKNTYHRIIGFSIMAKNAKWDTEDKFLPILEKCFMFIRASKPIGVRKMVSVLKYIAYYKPCTKDKILGFLREFNPNKLNDNMGPLIKKDVDTALNYIENNTI